jgi:hypothetical protein
MSRELPFPVSFEVPEGWRLANPDEVGEKEAAYVCLRRQNLTDPFVTNFTLSGLGVNASVDVETVAANHLTALQAQYPVVVERHDVLARGAASEVAQLLAVRYPIGAERMTLKQIQIVSAYEDQSHPDVFAVIQMVLTCPDSVFAAAGAEFARFIATFAPKPPEPAPVPTATTLPQ